MNTDDTWTLLDDPLDDWDGKVPKDDPGIVVEWMLTSGVWEPRYFEG